MSRLRTGGGTAGGRSGGHLTWCGGGRKFSFSMRETRKCINHMIGESDSSSETLVSPGCITLKRKRNSCWNYFSDFLPSFMNIISYSGCQKQLWPSSFPLHPDSTAPLIPCTSYCFLLYKNGAYPLLCSRQKNGSPLSLPHRPIDAPSPPPPPPSKTSLPSLWASFWALIMQEARCTHTQPLLQPTRKHTYTHHT